MIKNCCIFYLVNNNSIHLNRLRDSVECLKRNFLNDYPYPIVFGHEGLPADVVEEIKKYAPENHFFYNVRFQLPEYSDEIKNKIPEKFKGHWDEEAFFSMGYRHMCRFYSGDIYKRDFFSNVKYLLRLDCDSYLIDKVNFDLFEFMSLNKKIYATVGEKLNEMDYVIVGLEDHVKSYFRKKTIPDIHSTYDTHFELVDFQWFKTGPYIHYFDSIDKTGNIYIGRWGDAPIKYQGVNALLKSNQIQIFDDLPYRHGGNY